MSNASNIRIINDDDIAIIRNGLLRRSECVVEVGNIKSESIDSRAEELSGGEEEQKRKLWWEKDDDKLFLILESRGIGNENLTIHSVPDAGKEKIVIKYCVTTVIREGGRERERKRTSFKEEIERGKREREGKRVMRIIRVESKMNGLVLKPFHKMKFWKEVEIDRKFPYHTLEYHNVASEL